MRVGADLYENRLFIEKRDFRPILVISGPSRPQEWIWLEILRWKMVSGGLETLKKLRYFAPIVWQLLVCYCSRRLPRTQLFSGRFFG